MNKRNYLNSLKSNYSRLDSSKCLVHSMIFSMLGGLTGNEEKCHCAAEYNNDMRFCGM